MPQELMPWEDPPAPTVRTKESMPWEEAVPSVTSRVVRYDMPEPPGAPKIAALQPGAPAPPGFGQRVYEQTLQGPVELVKGMWIDPKGTLMKTLAGMTATQIQGVQNPMRIQAASPVTPIIEDVRSGNLSGAAGGVTGLGLTLLTPVIAAKSPKVIRATPTAVRGAVEGGLEAARSGKTIAESGLVWTAHQVGGPKAAAAVAATTTGTRVAAGAVRGARSALKARAAAAAEALAAENAAAAEAARPTVIPEERRLTSSPDTSYVRAVPGEPTPPSRQLPPGATQVPPAADTSYVRGVPGEYAAPELLPPSRQLAAPGPSAIVTPAPDPLAGDTSGVRAVPAVYGSPAVNEAAVGMREAMGLQPGELTPPAIRPAPVKARKSQIDQMARHMRDAGLTAADAILLDPPDLARLAENAGIEGPLAKTLDAVRKRLKAMEKADAETAKYQAAWDKLSKSERRAFFDDEAAPPPAAPPAEPVVTTPAEANVELGKRYPAPEPVETPAPLTASQKRVKAVSKWLAEEPIGTDLVEKLETDAGARLLLGEQSRRLGHRSIGPGEIPQIVEEVKRLRGEGAKPAALQPTPIAKAQADFEAAKAAAPDEWFGASKVIDEKGEPLTVYHGTTHNVEEFRHGINKTDEGYLGKGFYFSDPKTANIYAGSPILNKYGEPYNPKSAQLPGGNVMPVHLKMQNPLEVNAEFKPRKNGPPIEIDREITVKKALGLDKSATSQDITDTAKKLGYDGVIYDKDGTKEYAVFDPANIRSAIGRRRAQAPTSKAK